MKKSKILIIIIAVILFLGGSATGVLYYTGIIPAGEECIVTDSIVTEYKEKKETKFYRISKNTVLKALVRHNLKHEEIIIFKTEQGRVKYTVQEKSPVIFSEGITTYKVSIPALIINENDKKLAILKKDTSVFGEFINNKKVWVISEDGVKGWVPIDKLSVIETYHDKKYYNECKNFEEYIYQF